MPGRALPGRAGRRRAGPVGAGAGAAAGACVSGQRARPQAADGADRVAARRARAGHGRRRAARGARPGRRGRGTVRLAPGARAALRHAVASGVPLRQIVDAAREITISLAVSDADGSLRHAASRLGVTDRALQLHRQRQRTAGAPVNRAAAPSAAWLRRARAQCAARTRAAASARPRAPSFSSRLWTWFLTVLSSMHSRAAISLLESPSSMSATIWRSRDVSGASTACAGGPRAVGDAAQQRRGDPRRARRQLAARDGLRRRHELVERRVAGHERRHAGLGARDDAAVVLRRRERDQAGAGRRLPDRPRRADPGRRRGVDEDDVGAEALDAVARLLAGGRAAEHAQLRRAVEPARQLLPVDAHRSHDEDEDHVPDTAVRVPSQRDAVARGLLDGGACPSS